MTKLRFWDRILAALMGILCIAAAAAIVAYAFGLFPVQLANDLLQKLTAMDWRKWLIIGASALLLVLIGLHGIGMLFRRRKDKGFVVQHTDYGDMSISMKAMENMVKKCVDSYGELTVNHTKIYLVRNGVSIDMKITLAAGVNIPLTVNSLQKQIKQYITSCSGVDVHEVRVKVETDNLKLLPAPQSPVVEPEPAEEVKCVEAPAEREYQYKEEPEQYTAAPEAEKTEEPAAEPVKEAVAAEEAPVEEKTEEKPEEKVEEPASEEQPEETAKEETAEETKEEAVATEAVEEAEA
ncbi:MAG: alkaline shock response membrane anchor protein AmaP [Clostridia bacterium]|nr:alkaline shock response membrane anchor protein AmaP [Clostridia bacterium]